MSNTDNYYSAGVSVDSGELLSFQAAVGALPFDAGKPDSLLYSASAQTQDSLPCGAGSSSK